MSIEKNSDLKGSVNKSDTIKEQSKGSAFTPRVMIALIIMASFIVWVNLGMPLAGAGYIGGGAYEGGEVPSLFGMAILIILCLLTFRIKPVARALKLDFSREEISSVYMGAAFMVSILIFSSIQPILGVIAMGPWQYLEDPTAFSHVGVWSELMFVWDQEALQNFMMGDSAVPWSLWIVPMFLWGMVYASMIFLLFALGALFYDRWDTAERLTFPLVKPVVATINSLEGTSEDHNIKNKIFIAGLAIAGFLQLLRLLNMYFPGLPAISLDWDIGAIVPGQIGEVLQQTPGTHFRIYLFVVGIGYFLSTQFGFSIWFFYFIIHRLIMNYSLDAAGLPITGNAFGELQYRGAYIVMALIFVYLARGNIASYFKAALGKASEVDPEKMPMSPKLLVYGSLVCILFLVIMVPVLLQISPMLMIIHIFLLLCVGLFHARCRTEAGMPFASVGLFTRDTMMKWFGSRPFSDASLQGIVLFSAHSAWGYTTSSAWMMEGLKLGDETGTKKRDVIKVMLFSLLVIFVVGVPLYLRGIYRYGAMSQQFGAFIYGQVLTGSMAPQDPTRYALPFSIAGGGLALIFSLLYMNFLWWPFHPLGYVLGMQTDFGFRFPGSFFVAWLVKVILLRYGGASLYNKFKPLFMGLIISDVVCRILITVIASAFPV